MSRSLILAIHCCKTLQVEDRLYMGYVILMFECVTPL